MPVLLPLLLGLDADILATAEAGTIDLRLVETVRQTQQAGSSMGMGNVRGRSRGLRGGMRVMQKGRKHVLTLTGV